MPIQYFITELENIPHELHCRFSVAFVCLMAWPCYASPPESALLSIPSHVFQSVGNYFDEGGKITKKYYLWFHNSLQLLLLLSTPNYLKT